MSRNDDNLPANAFLSELQEAVANMPARQIKAALLTYASDLPPSRRLELLQMLVLGEDAEENDKPEPDRGLAADCETFAAAIRAGAYTHELDIANPSEVPAWVDDMDVLFDRADQSFAHGDYKVAAKAYGILLDSLHLAENIAVEHSMYSAQDIVVTDINAVKARHLRSLYETLPAKERAPKLLEALRRDVAFGSRIGLAEVEKAADDELAGRDKFLRSWISELEKAAADANLDGFEDSRRALLREAVQLQNGLNGLRQLAEREGPAHAEAWYDLVAQLVRGGEVKQAEEACRSGIKILQEPHEKAVLADWLAELAFQDGDRKMALDFRRQAWRFEPSQLRLISWCATSATPLPDDQLAEEVEYLHSQQNARFSRLISMLEILRGEYELPRKAILAADPLGWTPESHPGPLVYTFLLVAGSGLKDIPEGSSIAALVEANNTLFIRWQNQLAESGKIYSYLDAMMPALRRHKPNKSQRELFLATARTVCLDRVKAILSAGWEHAFDKAARMAVGFAEACFLAGGRDEGLGLLTTLRNQHLRNHSFRSKLRSLINESPLLPAVTEQGNYVEKPGKG
ncbi:MAG: hypothetical protein RL095_1657 [Verrucomicrobiota bacterium]|jgi:tetratricopeptide (TPR) repeat protein